MANVLPYDRHVLDALRRAVAEALDRKRRLGQYAIIWRDGQAVRVEPAALPSLEPNIDSDRDGENAER